MQGIVSLLGKIHDELVRDIWQELEINCGLTGVLVTPLPYFSWQIAEDYQRKALDTILQDIATATPSFKIRTSDLGFFTAENPVAYIPIIRTKELSEFHEMVWD
jgi:hypothetical protein